MRPVAAVAIILTSALAQDKNQKVGASIAPNIPLVYRIGAVSYCSVERSLTLHEVVFDLHNSSCQRGSKVTQRKIPTLPKSPLYRDVRISGYHFTDWSDGQPSPIMLGSTNVQLLNTATTISASGWLGKASCVKSNSGHVGIEESFWRARVVPEVQFVEDLENQEPAPADIVPPGTTAVMTIRTACADGGEESLRYSVTPVVEGVAKRSIYISPVMRASKTDQENDATLPDAALSVHSRWNAQRISGTSELTVTVIAKP